MKLSKKCEYSFLLLIELGKAWPRESPLPAEELACVTKVPRKFLDKIMGELRGFGYVQSIRGSAGGYRLAKNPEGITMAEVIRKVDGPIAPVASVSRFFYAHTPSEQNPKLTACFQDIRDYTAKKLEEMTLAQLL